MPRDNELRLKTVDILGVDRPVFVTRSGYFEVRIDESADADVLGGGVKLDDAVEAAKVTWRKVRKKVSVPFIARDGKRGVAYGLHADGRTVLVRWADGKADRINAYGWRGREEVYPADTPAEVIERVHALAKQETEVASERERLLEEHKVDLLAAVTEALQGGEGDAAHD